MQNTTLQSKNLTAAIILAAGCSTRMQTTDHQRHKLLLPLGSGTVLSTVVSATLASQARPIIVVLGHQSEQIRASLAHTLHISLDGSPPDLFFAENTAFAHGMSTSLHAGLQALLHYEIHQTRQTCTGTLILLGDQPLITPSLLNRLITRQQTSNKQIIAPFYNGKRGNPVLFSADLFPELLNITGDEGARTIIERHRDKLEQYMLDDDEAWYDVDTWDTYQQVVQIWQKRINEAGTTRI